MYDIDDDVEMIGLWLGVEDSSLRISFEEAIWISVLLFEIDKLKDLD